MARRVRGAATQAVNVIEAANVNIPAAFVKITSGQLPFLGLFPFAPIRRRDGLQMRPARRQQVRGELG